MLMAVSMRVFVRVFVFLTHPLWRGGWLVALLWGWRRRLLPDDAFDQPFEKTSEHIYFLEVDDGVCMGITDFTTGFLLILTIPKHRMNRHTEDWMT